MEIIIVGLAITFVVGIIKTCYEFFKCHFPKCHNFIVGFFAYICNAEFIVPLLIYGWCCLGGIFCIGLHFFAMIIFLLGTGTLKELWRELKRLDPFLISFIVSIILTIILTATGVIETE